MSEHPATIAIMGAGAMGAAIGRLLADRGLRVLTPLAGRSKATRDRALAAGMADATLAEIARCGAILSIVPPSQAEPVAAAIRPAIAAAGTSPLFADCNAVHPDFVRDLAPSMEAAGASFVDAGILGGPPAPDRARAPIFYASGPHTEAFARLVPGLDVHPLAAPVGAASALKMAIAAVSKGMTALLVHGLMLAEREQVTGAMIEQLRRSQPGLSTWGSAQLPQLDAKAGRWVEEMDILADLAADLPGGTPHFEGLAELFAAISRGGTADHAAEWAEALRR